VTEPGLDDLFAHYINRSEHGARHGQ